MRLLSPTGGCKQVDIGLQRSEARYSGNILDVDNQAHISALRKAGYTPASVAGPPAKAKGFDCTECGFRSFFRKCGRCGHAPE